MSRSRFGLLILSAVLAAALAAGGLLARAGSVESPYRQAILFAEVLSLVVDNYVDPVDQDALLDGAFEGLVLGLDANGAYLTPAEVARWKGAEAAGGAEPGVSVLKVYGGIEVVAVAPGSPADRAGIGAGDQIRRIDGRSVREMSLRQAVRLLRGEPGSEVRLGILHVQEGFKREEVTVRRAVIDAPAYSVREERGVAILRIADLPRVDPTAVARDLETLRGKDVRRLLVDLRDSTTGGPREACRVAGLFARGDCFVLRERGGKELERVRADGAAEAWPGTLGVLVNGGTAGGSEAIAHALRTRRGALVYGETTYGLGAEPRLFELPDGSGVLVSAFLWEGPDGRTWNGEGLSPDRTIRGTGRPADADAEQFRLTLDDFAAKPEPNEAARKAA